MQEEMFEDDEEEYVEEPKTKDHVTTASIDTRQNEDGSWSGWVDYNTTGCTGQGGGTIGSCKTKEELIQEGKEAIEKHNIWCDSWAEYIDCEDCKGIEFKPGEECETCGSGRFDMDYANGKEYGDRNISITHRKNEKYTTILSIDGVKISGDLKTTSLTKWF
jgi:hypothetical protein